MTAISFRNVCKSYPMYQHLFSGGKASLLRPLHTLRSFKRDRYVALDDVSFDVGKGEAVGIIGPNGSGKSTAMGLIVGVLQPQAGQVEVAEGRLCPLLELGAGFHPDLTGRENIILNGILLGLTRREVLARMDAIEVFCELGQFLDQKLRTYSSGMVVRLGFSVAAHLEPDILVIDEVLAVGDIHFQAKCREKILTFRKRGCTIVLVSHSGADIQSLCDRAIWLSAGKIVEQGEPAKVWMRYQGEASAPFSPGSHADS